MELLHVNFFFNIAMVISIPCLVTALVERFRKRASVPPMIACGLTAMFYFWVYLSIPEMIYFLETIISVVLFAVGYVLYAHSPKKESVG